MDINNPTEGKATDKLRCGTEEPHKQNDNEQFQGEDCGILTREENDERNDNSQIHIKYAKMLEELENESIVHETIDE